MTWLLVLILWALVCLVFTVAVAWLFAKDQKGEP